MDTPANSIGACGDDCASCPRYLATVSKDLNALKRVRDLWVAFGWRMPDVEVQSLCCSGCRKENKCAYPQLRDCAFAKGYRNCGMCNNFPCDITSAAFKKTGEALQLMDTSIGTPEEMALLKLAFGNKKSNLDDIHQISFHHDRKESS